LNIFLNVRLLLSGVGYLTCHLTCSPKRGQQKVNAIQLHWLLLTNIARNHSKSATWKPNKTHNPLRRPASRFMSYKYRHGGLPMWMQPLFPGVRSPDPLALSSNCVVYTITITNVCKWVTCGHPWSAGATVAPSPTIRVSTPAWASPGIGLRRTVGFEFVNPPKYTYFDKTL